MHMPSQLNIDKDAVQRMSVARFQRATAIEVLQRFSRWARASTVDELHDLLRTDALKLDATAKNVGLTATSAQLRELVTILDAEYWLRQEQAVADMIPQPLIAAANDLL